MAQPLGHAARRLERGAGAALGRRVRRLRARRADRRAAERSPATCSTCSCPYALLGGLTTLALFAFHGALFLTLRVDGELEGARAARGARRRAGGCSPRARASSSGRTSTPCTRTRRASFPASSRSRRSCCRSSPAHSPAQAAPRYAFAATALSIVLVTATLFLNLYPRVLVSSTDKAYSLTIFSTSSSHYTLTVMSIVAVVLTPSCSLYQAWTYWVFRARLTGETAIAARGARALAARLRHLDVGDAPARPEARAGGSRRAPVPRGVRRSRSRVRRLDRRAGGAARPHRRGRVPRPRGPRHAHATARRPRRGLRRARPARLGVRERRRAHCGDDARDAARARARAARRGPVPAGSARCRPARSPAPCSTAPTALEPYFARFLPQLALATVIPPVLLVWIALHDLTSAIVLACTRAADPGLRDPDRQGDRARDDAPLAGALAALDALRRCRARPADAARVPARRGADRVDRRRTPTTTGARRCRTLRIALSVGVRARARRSLGTAVVAVELGIRLVHGSVALAPAFAILVLAPELLRAAAHRLGSVPCERRRARRGRPRSSS